MIHVASTNLSEIIKGRSPKNDKKLWVVIATIAAFIVKPSRRFVQNYIKKTMSCIICGCYKKDRNRLQNISTS